MVAPSNATVASETATESVDLDENALLSDVSCFPTGETISMTAAGHLTVSRFQVGGPLSQENLSITVNSCGVESPGRVIGLVDPRSGRTRAFRALAAASEPCTAGGTLSITIRDSESSRAGRCSWTVQD